MIVPAQRLAIVIATQPVDFRCGHDALAAIVQTRLGLDPHSGLMVVVRWKRKDRAKILVWDGSGLVLVYKRHEAGGISWPRVGEGVARISRAQCAAQFAAVFDGLEWQRLAVKRVVQLGAAV